MNLNSIQRVAHCLKITSAAMVLAAMTPGCTTVTSLSVRDFGAIGDGKTLNTAALQKALDAAAKAGGVVRIPVGNYVTGSLVLKSHTTLHLDSGARLLGSANED